jgi:digeranylgeranylglycerophospholipid reductase
LELLNRFIDSHPEIKKGKPIRFLAGAVPVSKPIQAVKNNVMLVGDAARQADPITGGGLMASIEAGMIAGRTIGKAVEEQREEVLLEYTKTLEKSLYKKLRRNYRVKEILLGFEDKTLNKLADSLKDYKFEEFSTLSIIKALISKHPSLLLGI